MINVKDICGPYCISLDDGIKLKQLIEAEIERKGTANVSFQMVDVFLTPFFNGSFGALLKNMSRKELFDKVDIHHLSKDGWFVLNQVIANADEYFRNKKTVDATFKSFQEE